MPVLDNSKHELFAQALATGETADAAYVKAGYKANRGNAATLKTNQSILDRVEELKAEAAKGVTFDLEQGYKWLQEIIETPIGKITRDHKLAQEYSETEHGTRLKMPGKMDAFREIAKLRGWYAPEKKQVELTAVDKVLTSIMHGKAK